MYSQDVGWGGLPKCSSISRTAIYSARATIVGSSLPSRCSYPFHLLRHSTPPHAAPHLNGYYLPPLPALTFTPAFCSARVVLPAVVATAGRCCGDALPRVTIGLPYNVAIPYAPKTRFEPTCRTPALPLNNGFSLGRVTYIKFFLPYQTISILHYYPRHLLVPSLFGFTTALPLCRSHLLPTISTFSIPTTWRIKPLHALTCRLTTSSTYPTMGGLPCMYLACLRRTALQLLPPPFPLPGLPTLNSGTRLHPRADLPPSACV